MPLVIETPHLQFSLNLDSSHWSLNGTHIESPSLEGVWMRINYHMGFSAYFRTRQWKFKILEKWHKPQVYPLEHGTSRHGPIKKLTLEIGPDVNGIRCRVDFALAEQHPLFLWRLTLMNSGRRWIRVDRIEMLRAGFFEKRRFLPNPGPLSLFLKTKPVGYGAVRPNPHPGRLRFYSNGWQSWSFSGSYGPKDRCRSTQLGPFAANVWYVDGKTPKRKPGRFTSNMYGVIADSEHRTGILAGFLSQKEHFGIIDADIADRFYPALRMWADGDSTRLDPGEEMSTDWAVLQFMDIDDPDPLTPYLAAVAREHDLDTLAGSAQTPVGWCSWYQHAQNIDQQIIRSNLESAKMLGEKNPDSKHVIPVDIFQIDDGFEAQIGDWHDFDPGFPDGVAPLAREIREAGFTPGLWLAPLIVHSRSKLAHQHPDWLLRNRQGLPVNAGFIWNNFNKALDPTHPAALAYIGEVVRTAAQDWGYPYLKLDFLYAAAIKGRYNDQTLTRAQVLRKVLETIREAAGPESILLGCGVPLGSAIGIFDSVRIGADVSSNWEPRLLSSRFNFRVEPNLPAARNALQNSLTRSGLHNRWWLNDPDCLILRPDADLTLPEIQSLATTIAITGGAFFLTDDLAELPQTRLGIAAKLVPPIGKRARVLDWIDKTTPELLRLDLENQTGRWHLLAVFNWGDVPQDRNLQWEAFDLPERDYFARDFWNGVTRRISDGVVHLAEIPPHGVRLLSVRPIMPGNPSYLGSDLHISQGLCVTEWQILSGGGLRCRIERPGTANGVADLHLPQPPVKATLNNQESTWERIEAGIYRFPVRFDQQADLEIEWD